MVKFIHKGSQVQPLKMQNPITSQKAPPSMATRNEEPMHERSPDHSRMGTAKTEGRTAWEQLQKTKKNIYTYNFKQHFVIVQRVIQTFQKIYIASYTN